MIFFTLIFSQIVNASQWCDIKKIPSNEVLHTYEGICNQSKFGGPWGSSALTVHVVNATKQADLDTKRAEKEAKLLAKRTIKDRIKTADVDGASASQLKAIVKDIVDYLKESD